jgi:hypothetical protein
MPVRPSRPRPAFPPPPSSATFRTIAIVFLGITALVAIGALWLSSVQARIVVTVKPDVSNIQTAIEVARSPESGQLQGRVVRVTQDSIEDVPVSASARSEVAFTGTVTGTVRIVNNYSRAQTLVQKTRLLTSDGRLYRIDKTVTLQPKESATVPAYADQSGASYALNGAVKFKIPGLWEGIQDFIYAERVSGFSAAPGSGPPIVTSADLEKSLSALEEKVYAQATKILLAEAGSTTDTKAIFTRRVVDKKANVLAGQAADRFLASVKLEVTGVIVPKADLEAFLRQSLRSNVEGREVTDLNLDAVSFTVDRAETVPERAKIAISAQTVSKLTAKSPDLALDRLTGLPIADAEKQLKEVDGVEDVAIKISPGWITRLPKMEERIEMVVK